MTETRATGTAQRNDTAVWWHVYPLGFCGAPIRDVDPEREAAPRLRRLLGWLDHAAGLGATGLLLGPVFAAQTHGYDTLDHYRIDPRLGTDQDFDALVTACRERGLDIVLDGVFSHVGDRHPWLLDALAHGPHSTHGDLFDVDWDADDGDASGPRPRVWEGHGSLARLNHHSEAAVDLVADVMIHWLDRGVAGWRLDAAYSVAPEFWARVLPLVRERHPGAWILGEVIHGDYAGFVAASGVDTVTQYELWKAIWSALADRNFFELDWTLRRHDELLRTFVPQTFIGNHDVTRIASTLGVGGALIAAAVLATVGGVVSVYAGDELGMLGVKTEGWGGDDAVRPAFPDSAVEVGYGGDVYEAYRSLIAVRRARPWLPAATTTSVQLENTRYGYRSSARDGHDWIDVEIDLGTEGPTVGGTVIIRDRDGHTIWQHTA